MKASELRVGNWVSDRGGKTLQVDRIYGNKIEYDVKGLPTHSEFSGIPLYYHPLTEEIEYCQPIPLTEEWLVNFGFEKHDYDLELSYIKYNRKPSNYGCEYKESNFWIIPNGDDDHYRIPIKLLFVHQLQNLYYALTNEELTLNK